MAVLAECLCHRKQSLRNKVCSCGQDLVKLKKSNKINYWIVYRLPGGKQRFEKMTGENANSLEYARDVESKRRVQKREKRPIFEMLPQAEMSFQELTDWYLSLESVKEKRYYPILQFSLKKFNRIFGTRIVADIKPSELEDHRARRKKEGKAESTIDQEISAAKVVINKAFLDDKVGGEVLKRFKSVKKYLTGEKRNSNQRRRVLSPQEYTRLESSAPVHLKPILRTGYDTGMREGEILQLKWGMVFLKDHLIRLPKEITKDYEDRDIPISGELYDILDRLPRGIRDDYPIFTYKGKEIKDFRTGLKKACTEAKILYGRFKGDGFIFHDLRRTFYTDMRKAGIQESVIKAITGHSRNEVSDRYNQVDMEDMKQAIDRLTQYRRNQIESVYQNVYQAPVFNEKGLIENQLTL
jgi:integrase